MFCTTPLKFLHEAKPFIVTIETKNGLKFRGKLVNIENNLNCFLENTFIQEKNGKIRNCLHIYIRGSEINMIILPEILKSILFS
jgi:small nuclear ribonucleoprotein D3